MLRPFRINVDNLGTSTFVGHKDANLDPHPHPERDKRVYQCSVKVDRDGLTFARQRFSSALRLDCNPESNSGTSALFTSKFGGDMPPACASLVRMDSYIRHGIIHPISGSQATNSQE